MARFDKKWWFVHVPAGVAVVALIIFGVNQCDGKNDENAEKVKAQQELVDAGRKIEIAANRMDSLLAVNRDLGADNVRKGDTIRVLKDSVNTLNGQVRELKHDNDSLVTALTDCRNSKKKSQPAEKVQPVKKKRASGAADKPAVAPKAVKQSPKPRVENTWVPSKPVPSSSCRKPREERTANVRMNASYNNGNIVVDNAADVVDVKLENGSVNNGNVVVEGANTVCRKQGRVNVGMSGSHNNGIVVVEGAHKDANVTMGGRAVNNGAIIIGDGNSVYHVTPDTIVRFTAAKNTVVKCRIITKQRQYR